MFCSCEEWSQCGLTMDREMASRSAVVCAVVLILVQVVSADQVSEDSTYIEDNEYSVAMVACASAITFLLLVVYLVTACTDCYKSEVSTDFHPATGHTEVKWGGAGGYTSATSSSVNDSVLGAGFTDEMVLPSQASQVLPYAMRPSQVPEAQGFCGYGSVPAAEGLREPGAGQGEWNQAAHGGSERMGHGGARHLPGSHVSPVDFDDPPPPYM